jgi:ribosomal-protein-serine acetyltransferase
MSGQGNNRPNELVFRAPVTLRRLRAEDSDALYRAVTESLDHLRPWLAWAQDYSRESAAEYLAGSIRHWDDGTEYNYAIVTDGVLVGSAGLMARIGPGGLEIGYWVHRAHTGRGLAPRPRKRWWSRRSGCPAWTGWRSCTTS